MRMTTWRVSTKSGQDPAALRRGLTQALGRIVSYGSRRQGDLVHASRQARRDGAGANTHDRPGDARAGFHAITETNDLRLVIEPTPCTDVMSGNLFETTVTVSLNNQTYHGCGGPLK